ncbi:pentapeptide repeat-containing protein [Eudoraea chungangensis]|uniref:pentapeptide repeat-containing protein n=1 Tax=Eudoraea chungangensis TaxID=1481905 RepID=UPI0023ED47F8|nr:hypothetical protein [Eudoraea chungangensis]
MKTKDEIISYFKSDKSDWYTISDNGKKIWDKTKVREFWKLIRLNKMDVKDYNFDNFVFPEFESPNPPTSGNTKPTQCFWRDINSKCFENKTTFKSAKFLGRSEFKKVIFGGKTYFKNSTFEERTTFIDSEFKEFVSFYKARFSDSVSYRGTNFERLSSFRSVKFRKDIVFFFTRFIGDVEFDNAKFDEKSVFQKIDFNRKASFFEIRVRNNLLFKLIRIIDDQFLVESIRFEKNGLTTFWDCNLNRNVLFRYVDTFKVVFHLSNISET